MPALRVVDPEQERRLNRSHRASAIVTRVLILFATQEGQTGRIAEHLASRLQDLGVQTEVRRMVSADDSFDPDRYDGLILGASIHYGHHPSFLLQWVRKQRGVLGRIPAAFFSVCLSAGGPGARPETAQAYLAKFLDAAKWQPALSASFAGALLYTRYPWWKKGLMLMILRMAGGDTDASRDFEYTDWQAVEAFAESFRKRLRGVPENAARASAAA
jgi:menaquinone-dependent protoporphyrinogen oxidase